MANLRKKNYKKIKRVGWVGTVITFIIICIALTFLLVTAVSAFVQYMLDTKIANEYEKIEYMARLYDIDISDGTVDHFDNLNVEGRDFLITDSSGDVLYTSGQNTCTFKGGLVKIRTIKDDVLVYEDIEECFVYPKNGSLVLNKSFFYSDDEEGYKDDEEINMDGDSEEDFEESLAEAADMIKAPIWISVPVNDGQQNLVAKAYYKANKNDLVAILKIGICLGLAALVIMIIVIKKIVSNILRQRRLMKLYFTDDTTGRKNRTWYFLKGEQILKKGGNKNKKYAVVSLTFTNYRNYCICHSMDKGVEMLSKIHELIDSTIEKKEISAHMSSSSFALLLEYENEDILKNRLEVLIERLEHIDSSHKFDFQVGVKSIDRFTDESGRVISRKNIDIEKEYNSACMARESLGDSDESGLAFFNEELIEERRWIDKVQDNQKKALENEEFAVYYQPKYDPRTNELRGAEALIRWISPDFGFVAPGKFIPIFEKNGFITEIDHYMLSHVARDQRAWLDQGFKCVPVSVNVSRAHFIESDLAEQIRDAVDKEGTPHEFVEIELTESAFFDDKNQLVETIKRLKSYGFTVSMDDFGSGYSSLNSLKDMPLDVLKLDAEFFRGENEGERGEIVVSEAIKLAKSLKMKTVAEGVEVKEQVDFLAKEGCDMIQGFYYAKPMPKDEFELQSFKKEQ